MLACGLVRRIVLCLWLVAYKNDACLVCLCLSISVSLSLKQPKRRVERRSRFILTYWLWVAYLGYILIGELSSEERTREKQDHGKGKQGKTGRESEGVDCGVTGEDIAGTV